MTPSPPPGQRTGTSIRLSDRDCDAHELFAWGTLAPLRGYPSRSDLDRVRSHGELVDGTPWRWPWRLRAGTEVRQGDLVSLLEPEGQRLGTVEVTECWAEGNDRLISGPVRLDRVPGTAAFGELHRPPADFGPEAGERAGLLVDGPLSAAEVQGALRVAAGTGRPLLLMPLLGADGPSCAPSTVAAVRGVRAVAALAGSQVEVAGLPLPPTWWRTPEQRWLVAKVARGFGVTTLLTGEHVGPAESDRTTAVPRRCPRAEDVDPALHHALGAVLAASRPPAERDGLVVLLTGLPASGKSTLARGLRDRIVGSTPRSVTLLDGDIVRNTLSPDLSFSRADRLRNLSRLATVAAECARHGGMVVCAPVAPHEEGRELFRRTVATVANFLLVHVATPVRECQRRDPKGLYAAAAAGTLHGLTGVDDPYEVPAVPDVVVGARGETSELALTSVLDELTRRGWVRPGPWDTGC